MSCDILNNDIAMIDCLLSDISLNIDTLIQDFNITDVSNQIYDLSFNLNRLNTKIKEVVEIYDILNDLKTRNP